MHFAPPLALDRRRLPRFNARMSPSRHVTVEIDLARVRQNALEIARRTRVPLIAVVKADAYGLGAAAVADAIGDVLDSFYVFDTAEAVAADLFGRTGKPSIALLSDWTDAADFRSQHIRPVVWTAERAAALAAADPVLSLDTAQQRFAAPAEQVEQIVAAGQVREAMTHATRPPQAHQLVEVMRRTPGGPFRLHAAASALLADSACWLNAVRPGLALYQDAVRVSVPLEQATDARGPAGYSGFHVPRFGVILAGYRNGLAVGPCLVNGAVRHILEVGMQSAFVEIGPGDRRGDEVVLLGDALTPQAVGQAWGRSPQEALLRLSSSGTRRHRPA